MTSPQPNTLWNAASWAWWLGPAFLALAAVLAANTGGGGTPAPAAAVEQADLAPRRRPLMQDPAAALVAGERRLCSDCHAAGRPPLPAPDGAPAHAGITLAHGMNDACINCHGGADRQQLVLHDESTVPFEQVPTLCSQCHGTAYRDWQRGTHGKTTGSWLAPGGRMVCTECHDPHSPAYPSIRPLPGPAAPDGHSQHGAADRPATRRAPA